MGEVGRGADEHVGVCAGRVDEPVRAGDEAPGGAQAFGERGGEQEPRIAGDALGMGCAASGRAQRGEAVAVVDKQEVAWAEGVEDAGKRCDPTVGGEHAIGGPQEWAVVRTPGVVDRGRDHGGIVWNAVVRPVPVGWDRGEPGQSGGVVQRGVGVGLKDDAGGAIVCRRGKSLHRDQVGGVAVGAEQHGGRREKLTQVVFQTAVDGCITGGRATGGCRCPSDVRMIGGLGDRREHLGVGAQGVVVAALKGDRRGYDRLGSGDGVTRIGVGQAAGHGRAIDRAGRGGRFQNLFRKLGLDCQRCVFGIGGQPYGRRGTPACPLGRLPDAWVV
jgi:hypothetical protein